MPVTAYCVKITLKKVVQTGYNPIIRDSHK